MLCMSINQVFLIRIPQTQSNNNNGYVLAARIGRAFPSTYDRKTSIHLYTRPSKFWSVGSVVWFDVVVVPNFLLPPP